MKRFRDIIQDIKAPSTSDLWINNGELKYYTSNGWKAITGNGSSDVYVLPGNLQITTGWSTTDVESIVGNWDEFTKAVSDGKIIACSLQDEETIIKSIALVAEVQDGAFIVSFSVGSSFYIYIIDQSSIILNIDDTFLFYSSVTDSLNSTSSKKNLSLPTKVGFLMIG